MSRPSGSRYKFLDNPQTKVYDYNYGVGMNFYQPMVDYIDDKDKGRHVHYPHLPWTEERGLVSYDPNANVKSYSEEDLCRVSRQTAARAREHLRGFKGTTQSAFQLSKTVSAATISEKVHTEVKKTKKQKLLRQIKLVKTKMADDMDYRVDQQKIQQALESSKKYRRVKSAKEIETQLLSEAMKNISSESGMDIKQYQREQSMKGYDTTVHCKLMTERMSNQLEDSFMKPLDDLSKELIGFDRKTTHYYYDQR